LKERSYFESEKMKSLETQLFDMNKSGWLTRQQEIPTRDTADKDHTYSMEKLLQETRDLRRKLNEKELNAQMNVNDSINSRS